MPRMLRLPGLDDLSSLARVFEFRTVSRWVGLGLVVGLLAGLMAAGFFLAMDWMRFVALGKVAHLQVLEPRGEHSLFPWRDFGDVRWWAIVLVPALGGLVSGLLVTRFAPEAEGHGTDAVIDSFHRGRGFVRPRVVLVKAFASIAVIGTGGSAGREGPIAHIGAGLGSAISGFLKLSDRERRLLLLAGAAAGIGAIFRTPLGAALFVVEALYRDDIEVDALVPCVFASVVAYSVFTLLFGGGAILATEARFAFDPRQLPFYLVMAMGVALIGVVFIKALYWTRDRVFAPLRLPTFFKPVLGGLAVGLLALVASPALGAGYGWLQEALLPSLHALPGGWTGAGVLLGIALLKVLTTCLSVGSGGSGGVFGPSVVIGGMTGGAFGYAFHELAPTVVTQPSAFIIVGMACFVGGVTHAPIASLVMASELTGSYGLLVPIMLAEAVTFAMMRRFTLYEKQVPTRRDSPVHGGEYVLDLLQNTRVGDVLRGDSSVEPVLASTPVDQLLRSAAESKQSVFPVVAEDGTLQGMVTLDTIRGFFFDEHIGKIAIAQDCAVPIVTLTPDDSLASALESFSTSRCPQLPVVSKDGSDHLIGLLSYEELLEAYSQELMRRRAAATLPPLSTSRASA